MNAEVRAELDRIREFLEGPDGSKLWDVLSALRGPDNENREAKNETVRIRRAAFGVTPPSGVDFYDWGRGWAITGEPPRPTTKALELATGWHFTSHICAARRALGLEHLEYHNE